MADVYLVLVGTENGEPFQDGPLHLGLMGEWSTFCKWVRTLPPAEREVLTELADDGEAEGTILLADELAAALVKHKPGGTALWMAERLAELIGVGAADETATVISEHRDPLLD